MPTLYLLIILSAFITPTFWILLFILVLFSWTSLVGVVRAEFLRGAQFRICPRGTRPRPDQLQDHVQALLPNALVSTVTFMPFILSGSVAH